MGLIRWVPLSGVNHRLSRLAPKMRSSEARTLTEIGAFFNESFKHFTEHASLFIGKIEGGLSYAMLRHLYTPGLNG